ncbi:MAG: hypothetical protein FWF65_02620 [Bacteroidetes bacterium]|nr:hypothetical protein [Bacteroidota bacterium]
MKKSFLLPNYFKLIGSLLAFPSLIILILNIFEIITLNFDFNFYGLSYHGFFNASSQRICSMNDTNFVTTILPIIIVIGLVFISFSKEKLEDEMITEIREKSFGWSIIVSSILFVLGTLFIYDIVYLYFLGSFIYLILLLFILKFHVELLRLKKITRNEE